MVISLPHRPECTALCVCTGVKYMDMRVKFIKCLIFDVLFPGKSPLFLTVMETTEGNSGKERGSENHTTSSRIK